MVKSKICMRCGNRIDASVNFCPQCGSSEFRFLESGESDNDTVLLNAESNSNNTGNAASGNDAGSGAYYAREQDYGYSQPLRQSMYGSGQQQPMYGQTQQQVYGQARHEYNVSGTPPYPASYNARPAYPMKWFKFLINFSLFAGALFNAIYGILYITGGIYFMQDDVSASAIYGIFGGMKVVDVLYGIMLIAIGAFGVFTRFQLAKYKANGPLFLYIGYAANVAAALFYCIAGSAITGISLFDGTVIVALILYIVLFILNYVYFRKRKALFSK